MAERLIAALETGIDTGEIVLVPDDTVSTSHIARCAGAPVCTQLVRERRRNRRNDGNPLNTERRSKTNGNYNAENRNQF